MSPTQKVALGGILAGAAILGVTALLQKLPEVVVPPAAIVTRETAARRWEVSRADRDGYFSDPARVNREIVLQPVAGKEPDSITELRIARLSSDSPVRTAGFREGDRILRIDGAPVSRLSEAVNLVHKIRAAVRLTVDVERSGQELQYQFDFR